MPKNGYAENLDLAYISRLESITMTRAEIMLRLEHCNRATVQLPEGFLYGFAKGAL